MKYFTRIKCAVLALTPEPIWIKSVCAALFCAVMLSIFSFFVSCERISENVLRLHVLANSDSEADQALKLKVRDAVLLEAEKWYQGASSFEEANSAVCVNLQSIQSAAEKILRENGSSDMATATVTERYFTTRHYEGFSLPAGRYRALQIKIGAAEGQNWWCMVYPALCIPASQKSDEEILAELPANEREILSEPENFQVRFKIVEWFESLKNWLGDGAAS